MRKSYIGFFIAAALWFVMFSPWTAHLINFWFAMAFSGVILTSFSLYFGGNLRKRIIPSSLSRCFSQLLLGILIAAVLWGVFWIGDKLSQLIFDFARPQVDNIYSIKGSTEGWVIALLLLFVIGPAEEIFWRGFLQESFSKYGLWAAFFITLAGYSFVHIWSFNFMLLCAAAVCGLCWGILYRFFPNWLPALIISHALWDAASFVIFPF